MVIAQTRLVGRRSVGGWSEVGRRLVGGWSEVDRRSVGRRSEVGRRSIGGKVVKYVLGGNTYWNTNTY